MHSLVQVQRRERKENCGYALLRRGKGRPENRVSRLDDESSFFHLSVFHFFSLKGHRKINDTRTYARAYTKSTRNRWRKSFTDFFSFFNSRRIFIARVYVTLFVRVRGFIIFLVCVHQHRVFDPPLVCKSNAY